MCGVAGMFGKVDERALRVMTQMLFHRGPDGGAVWLGDDAGFGHRRLKIIDLSDDARQPMLSDDGRCALTFNGEIFNYRELRRELRTLGHRFRTQSDSEVLLHACMQWGEQVVDRLVGQFAFAYHDARSGLQLLARDHLGIKPLYYSEQPDALYFASEAKALLAVLPDAREVDWELLPQYLTFLWVPGENTMFKTLRKLEPGSIITVRQGKATQRRYWHPVQRWKELTLLPEDAAERDEQLRTLLDDVVRSQLVADVPLGLLLSGGLDSTILLSAMAGSRHTPSAVTATYSKNSRARDVFDDDAPYARVAATSFDAELHEILIETDAMSLLPQVVWHLDEALADPTVITNYILSRHAKPTHTVLLTGMGADEIFAGYPRYPAVLLGEKLRHMPSGLPRLAGGVARALLHLGLLPLERARRPLYLLEHIHKDFERRFIGYSSYASEANLAALLPGELHHAAKEDVLYSYHLQLLQESEGLSPLSRMLAVDLCTFLPKLNLENMDKTSMAHAVEMRVPFLDHRLVEFTMTLPDSDKLGARASRKAALRRAWAGRIPDSIVHRAKTGYSPPVRGWMRDDMREFTHDMLLAGDTRTRHVFDAGEVRRLLDENTAGRRDHALRLWSLLVFELWMRVLPERRDWTPPADIGQLDTVSGMEKGNHE
jgi:asparagine synthase (glutamine-hydrolysing)